MSREARDRAWKCKQGTSQKLLLLALSEHADARGVCWPGNEILAERVGLEEKSLKKLLRDLEMSGDLYSLAKGGRKKGGYGEGNINSYFVTIGLEKTEIAAVLMTHPRFQYDPETALLAATDIVERVSNSRPLNRQQRVPDSGIKGSQIRAQRVPDSGAKGPRFGTHNNKVEPSIEPKEEPEEEEVESARPVSATASVSEDLPELPKTSAAICEVSGCNPNRLSVALFQGLKSSLIFLAHLDKNVSDEFLASEVRRRFAAETWPFERPPRPSQIEIEWFRQELILKKQEIKNANTTSESADRAAEGRRLRSLGYSNS